MIRFSVTTSITAYQTYEVEANSEEEARLIVEDPIFRADLNWVEAGWGDDEEIISVQAPLERFGGKQ